MPILPSTEALPVVTRQLMVRFEEIAPRIGFLRQFFPDGEPANTKEVQWSVRRIKEEVATSVARGDIGNRNELEKGTDKWVLPPLYRERLDITDMKLYDRVHGSMMVDSGYVKAFMNKVESDMRELVNKIERAYEIQCAQFLNDGKVVDATYGDYDFKRKAGSMVNTSGTYWGTDSNNPFTQISDGCTWLRTNGLCDGNRFLMLCGEGVLTTLHGNAIFKEQVSRNVNQLNTLVRPSRNPGGATFHGTLSCGDYEVEIWTYPQYYTPASGGSKRQFLEAKKISIIPENPEWMTAYGLVPQLVDEQNPTAKVGKYLYGEYKDGRKAIHEYDVQSCGLVIPVAVDRVYTRKVVA